MSRLADALGAKFLYYLGEFATFVRYVPLILSLIVVEGLMLRQLGEYFGVHNLVDYDKWSLQIGSGSGFGLMLVYLHCLYIGFLLVRAYRQNDPPKFRSFLTIVPLFSLVFVFLGYGFLSSLEGFRELLTHLWFCTGMAIALVLLTACHQLGETAAGWVLNRSEATIVDKCEQWRQQKENRLDFYCGTAIFLSYFVAMILLVTWVGAQRPTWVMYVFAAPFGVIFFAAAFRCRFSRSRLVSRTSDSSHRRGAIAQSTRRCALSSWLVVLLDRWRNDRLLYVVVATWWQPNHDHLRHVGWRLGLLPAVSQRHDSRAVCRHHGCRLVGDVGWNQLVQVPIRRRSFLPKGRHYPIDR